MLKELTKQELAFLQGGEGNSILGVTVSKITFNYSKTLERYKSVYSNDINKMLNNEIMQFTLELYSLNNENILNKDKCNHISLDISMSEAEYNEFCDNFDFYSTMSIKKEREGRYPEIKNIFKLDTLNGQEELYDIEYLFSNEVFKYISKKGDYKNKYILIPYPAAIKEHLSFSKVCLKGMLVIEVDNTYDFRTYYKWQKGELKRDSELAPEWSWSLKGSPKDACEKIGYGFKSDFFLP
jgi:hypothetical protein